MLCCPNELKVINLHFLFLMEFIVSFDMYVLYYSLHNEQFYTVAELLNLLPIPFMRYRPLIFTVLRRYMNGVECRMRRDESSLATISI